MLLSVEPFLTTWSVIIQMLVPTVRTDLGKKAVRLLLVLVGKCDLKLLQLLTMGEIKSVLKDHERVHLACVIISNF